MVVRAVNCDDVVAFISAVGGCGGQSRASGQDVGSRKAVGSDRVWGPRRSRRDKRRRRRVFRGGQGNCRVAAVASSMFHPRRGRAFGRKPATHERTTGSVVARGSAGRQAGPKRADLQVSEPLADSVTREMQPSMGRKAVCSV